tara:strand:+ start:19687 stop:20754 length:1068 start_codon:yes stop_codon:yes gene_type:complete
MFNKKTLAMQIDRAFSVSAVAKLVAAGILTPKIRKKGPFELPAIKPEYNYFCHLLGDVLKNLPELPDFSGDKKIAVMSDYGGEHSDALYQTYSFLFVAMDKTGPFQARMQELRQKHKIHNPYSEFKFKDLRYAPRKRALPEYLRLVDTLIHSALVTVAIDRKIESVFAPSKAAAKKEITKQLQDGGFGTWNFQTGEKLLRILHILSAFTAALTHDQQRLLWYSDNDNINADGHERSFSHTQSLFGSVGAMYMTHGFEILGFAKSLADKSFLDDLLSVPDLAAGILHDLVTFDDTGEDPPGDDGKVDVLKWIATSSNFLTKIHLRISPKSDGTYEAHNLTLEPKWSDPLGLDNASR